MKKKALTILSVILLLGMGTMGILAYLTDTEEITNVMTIGNVDITQTETDGKGKPFEQDQPLYPNSSIDKVVTVENKGTLDAYVRTWFAFENPIDPIVAEGINLGKPVGTDVIDGTEYSIYVVDYGTMTPGEVETTLKRISMKANATNENVAEYGDTYEVLVLSQAVQKESFDSKEEAWLATFGAPTIENHPWIPGTILVKNEEELKVALEKAKNGTVIQFSGGTYDLTDETLVIDKEITLEAADMNNKPVLKVSADDASGGSATIYHGIEIKSDNVVLKGLNLTVPSGVVGTGNMIQISHKGTEYYSDITIENCDFSGGDHCIALYGNDVTIRNCTLDESKAKSQGNIIYVWGTSGTLKIENNKLIGKSQKKHGISFYRQSDASKISGNIIIANNEFNNVYKGIVHESPMTYDNVSVEILSNTFTSCRTKPVAIDNGTFVSYKVNENVFNWTTYYLLDQCQIDNKVNTTINADRNYWVTSSPKWNKVINGNNVTVNNYYTDSGKTTLVNK